MLKWDGEEIPSQKLKVTIVNAILKNSFSGSVNTGVRAHIFDALMVDSKGVIRVSSNVLMTKNLLVS